MAWWDDVVEFAGSVVGAAGDVVEGAVDAVTEVAEEVTETVTDVADAGLDAMRDAAAAISPALGAIANVGLGVIKGAVHAVTDAFGIAFDILRNVGKLISDILHLNLADVIGDLGNLVINIGQAVVWALRVIFGAYFGKEVSDYFMRDRALTFIRTLIIGEFGKTEGEAILSKLGSGTTHFGLPINASVRIMRADSSAGADSFPFAALHPKTLDLFALAGLLSFNSFRIARGRTRVVQVDAAGNDMWWWPMTRSAIRSFLASGGTSIRIRAYAMTSYAAGKAMRTAFRKFKKLCIDLKWGTSFNLPSLQAFVTQPCRNAREFSFFAGIDGNPIDALWFAQNTPRDGQPDQDGMPLSIAIFGFEDGKFGLTTGRTINRGRLSACGGHSTADTCITGIPRQAGDYLTLDTDGDGTNDAAPADACGCGVTWRDPWPPYFSRVVLTHELGHYFGLAHAGHDGIDKIMISTADGSSRWDWSDSWWRLWLHGDAEFVEEDVEHAWRFIVKKMPHVLRAL